MLNHVKLFSILIFSILTGFSLSACQQETSQPLTIVQPTDYSLSHVLTCLPREGALIAAHRATSRNWDIPENSLQGLERLIQNRILVAEIDVAGLRDGTHILFHDGVWDEKTTGKGAVAQSTAADIDKVLLKKPGGALSAQRPALLSDALKLSKDKIFLEIDFKSSAKYEIVIRLIRDHNMSDQVILIGYTDAQAKKLQRLAPDMIVSVPGDNKGRLKSGLNPDKALIWMGRKINQVTGQTTALGYIGATGRPKDVIDIKPASRAKILVTDWADKYEPILGNGESQAYLNCMNER